MTVKATIKQKKKTIGFIAVWNSDKSSTLQYTKDDAVLWIRDYYDDVYMDLSDIVVYEVANSYNVSSQPETFKFVQVK